MIRPVLHTVTGAVTAALVVALLLTSIETFEHGYLDQGLVRLPLLLLADRLATLLVPALLLAALATAAAAVVSHVGRVRGRWPAAALALVVTCVAALLVHQVFTGDLVSRAARRAVDWLGASPVLVRLGWQEDSAAVWLALLACCAGLAVVRFDPDAQGTARRLLGRWLPLAGVLAALAVPVTVAVVKPAVTQQRNVVLIVLNTVAARHLASYGYHRVTTPEIDRLAARGTLHTRAFSMAPWTLPSHASTFTGLAPVRHRATQETLRLEPGCTTLAEILRDRGYQTFAASGNPIVGSITGLDQGFAQFLPTWRGDVAAWYGRSGEHPNHAALRTFLDAHDGDEPFFAFLNFNEAHAPYRPPPRDAARHLPADYSVADARRLVQSWPRWYAGTLPYSERDLEILRALYDGELATLSRHVGELVTMLERRGLLEQTLVIVTSDHGENLGDHGHLDHVFSLHETLLHVPLLLLGAGCRVGVTDDRQVDNTDLFQTILAAAAVDLEPPGSPARDLLDPQLRSSWPPRDLVAEYYFPNQVLDVFGAALLEAADGRLRPYLRRSRVLRAGEWKLVWGSDGDHSLYRLSTDPREQHDLVAAEPALVDELLERLARRLGELSREPLPHDVLPRVRAAGFDDLDEETRERLRSLGYTR